MIIIHEYWGTDTIGFRSITINRLHGLKAYLKEQRQASDRTVMNFYIIIQTIFNRALKDKLISPELYPFGKDKIQIKLPASLKVGLTQEEVVRLEQTDLSAQPAWDHGRNLWLFSFYFAGMRVSDVLAIRWSDIQDGRLTYRMGKNAKVGSLKCPDKALQLLERYKPLQTHPSDVIFPELKPYIDTASAYHLQRKTAYAVKVINQNLKHVATLANITKPLSMHLARHTFGNISGDRISIQMLQKLYRHSSITTTIGYQANFIHKDADDALAAVVGD